MIYNNASLIKHCFNNSIELIEDYTNIKINREYYIKGICKTIVDSCDKTFNKNFRQLVKTGPYCYNCAVEHGKSKYKLKCKYNEAYLNKICSENNITLTDDYTNKFINRDTLINGLCLTVDCNNAFTKSFRELEKINGFCLDCSKELGKDKIIKTNMKKFGCKASMQNQEVRNKQKQTIMSKYGVNHISQLDSIKEQKKDKSLEKYGTKCPLQADDVKIKTIKTNKIKYGVENPQQNQDIRNKTIETTLQRYGFKTAVLNETVKQKMITSNIEKYGVPHHSQNPEIAQTMMKSAFNLKKYTLPSGKVIDYQGYENFAIDELLNIEHITEEDLITNRKDVPEIWYYDKTNKKRRHYVDMYIKSQNRCIEVKSTWTNQEKNSVLEKQAAAIELGYKYEIWIYDGKGTKLETL
jgi:hypothetical protein